LARGMKEKRGKEKGKGKKRTNINEDYKIK
jgi:hypothetical protein